MAADTTMKTMLKVLAFVAFMAVYFLFSGATGWVLVGGNRRLAVVDQFTLSTALGSLPAKCFFGLWHAQP